MSRIKLLLDVISDVRSLADSLQAVADAMTENESSNALEEKAPVKDEKMPKKETVAKAKQIGLEEVRAKLAEISQSGRTSDVRDLIIKYQGSKLSDIDPSQYADLLKDAEVLANAK